MALVWAGLGWLTLVLEVIYLEKRFEWQITSEEVIPIYKSIAVVLYKKINNLFSQIVIKYNRLIESPEYGVVYSNTSEVECETHFNPISVCS
jgi:hypothetical protein